MQNPAPAAPIRLIQKLNSKIAHAKMPTPCAKIIQKNVRSFTTWLKKFIPKKAAIERDILKAQQGYHK